MEGEMYKRQAYLDKLVHSIGNGFIKVITGIRRSGKSFLLNTLFYDYLKYNVTDAEHIIRFAFDSAEDLERIGENPIELQLKKRKVDPAKFMDYLKTKVKAGERYFLLFDEIQELGAFESVLNSYLRKPEFEIYVTGSNAKFLSKDLITEFAGRSDQIHLLPLSFSEFMENFSGDKYQGFAEYLLYGGLPLVAQERDAEKKRSILLNLFDEVYIRDVVERNKIRNENDLRDLIDVLSSSVGSLSSAEKITNTFHSEKKSKITRNTVAKFMDYLEDSFLISSASRYDIKGKRYIGAPKKFYFTDLGLRNARLNFRQFEETHLMENAIYNELLYRGFNVDVGVVELAQKNDSGSVSRKSLEIDFVCNLGSERYYIQSAFSLPDNEKRAQEIRPFKTVRDSFKKIVVTKDFVPAFYDENGIMTMNVFDFLMNPDSLFSKPG
ncbi:ATP-binding protein [uncultured Fibrobacter sp.]|uniref:ATP-binding protein n=1 Tax=uncultured Fibrobacter sp. TaxID=261512 RepID=UPI00345064F9